MQNNSVTELKEIYSKILPYKVTIPATILAIGTVSALYSKKCYLIHSLGCLRSHLKKSVNLKSISQLEQKDQSLVYVSGYLQSKSTGSTAVIDPMFGVSSKINSLGVYRKLEVYKQLNDKQYDWININYQDEIPNDINHLTSNVTTNSSIQVENLTLAQPLLIELAEKNSEQIEINAQNIDQHFEEILKQFKALKSQQQQNQQNTLNQNIQQMYQNHPFNYAMSHLKDIYYEDNYIYIRGPNQLDLRISFHDVQNIVNVSLIALKDNNILTQFKIQELLTDKNYVKVMTHKGKFIYKNISLINFVEKGIVEHQEMIQKLFLRTSQTSIQYALIYAFVIYILYQILCDEVGPLLDYTNWEENSISDLAKQSITIQDNLIQVNEIPCFTTKYVLLSSLLHLPTVFLYNRGSSYSLLFGAPLFLFWLTVLNRKITYMNSIEEQIGVFKQYQQHFILSQKNTLNANANFFDQIEFTKK